MRINVAHLQTQGISFAVFAADARTGSADDRRALLNDLARRARRNGMRVDKAALVLEDCGRRTYFGTPDLVRYLSSHGVSCWTHTLEV
jgi:hypothetical protein